MEATNSNTGPSAVTYHLDSAEQAGKASGDASIFGTAVLTDQFWCGEDYVFERRWEMGSFEMFGFISHTHSLA